jgi:hypothetical protein
MIDDGSNVEKSIFDGNRSRFSAGGTNRRKFDFVVVFVKLEFTEDGAGVGRFNCGTFF